MAVPDSVTLRNLSGKYEMNKTLSSDPDTVLSLQGVSWFVRQAIKWSTITLDIKQYTSADNVIHVDIEQHVSSNVNTEERTLDGAVHETVDKVFGPVKGHSHFINLKDLEDDYLKDGWDQKWVDACEGEVVESFVESTGKKDGWTADQVWGFEKEGQGRRHVRHIVFKKGKKVEKIKTVYDWKGEL